MGDPVVLNIDELKSLVLFAADLGNLAGKVLEDGKISFTDIGQIISMVHGLKDLSAVDFKKAMPELKSLTPEQYDDLVNTFMGEFDISDAAAKASTATLLALSEKLFANIKDLKDWFQHVKSA